MKYLSFFLIISCLVIFAIPYTLAQETSEPTKAPETLEEAQQIGKKLLFGFPEAFKRAFQEAVEIWKQIGRWFKNLWNSYIFPWLQNLWYKINYFLGREVERRKPEIKEGFEEEKEELKEEVPKAGKSLWERFKELIK